ncbi:MAG: hypothetical protein K5705_16300 [Oscillospiraceae bacterium]|nr:hypothetical protein [Oscillospiraceae bacterium]
MKILRLYCPFGGKPWPGIVLTGICSAAILLSDAASVQSPLFLLLLLFLCIGGLCGLFWLEHRVTEEDRIMTEQADYAIWGPVTPNVTRRVSDIQPNYSSLFVAILLFLCLLLPFYHTLLLAEDLEEDALCTVIRLAAGLTILAICAFMLHFLYPIFAKKLSRDAVYTIIPVYRHYTVESHSRSGLTYFHQPLAKHYVVFYLPDGRYVLPVKREDAYAENIIIVKNNGFYLWYTDAADNPDIARRTILYR